MNACLTIFALILSAIPTVGADPVYQCTRDGTTIFTDKPDEASCRQIQLDVPQPDPAEVARMQEKKRMDAERERVEQEQAARDELLRAQVEAARAAARQADAERRRADREARDYGQSQQNGYWPGYYYSPGYYPGPWPIHPPGANPHGPPNPPGPNPPTPPPNYPYEPGRATLGGGDP